VTPLKGKTRTIRRIKEIGVGRVGSSA